MHINSVQGTVIIGFSTRECNVFDDLDLLMTEVV